MKSRIEKGVLLEFNEEDLIDGHFECSDVDKIGSYAFMKCINLKTVSLPKVTKIARSAFCDCTSLTEVNLPQVKTIGGMAFRDCTSLTEANLPEVTMIDHDVFARCTSLIRANLPQAETIGVGAFNGCISLTEANLPQVKTIGAWAFMDCTSLTIIKLLPDVKLDNNAFLECKKLQYLLIDDITQKNGAEEMIKGFPALQVMKIIIQSEQFKSLFNVQEFLNQNLGNKDISKLILNFSKQLGFFAQTETQKTAPEAPESKQDRPSLL